MSTDRELLERAREALAFALTMAEEEWNYGDVRCNGTIAITKMKEAVSDIDAHLKEQMTPNSYPNNLEPCTSECQIALDDLGDDRGQGLDWYWKWGFKAGWDAAIKKASPQDERKALAEPARKIGDSYQADGWVIARFKTRSGLERVVFEFCDIPGMLHIFSADQVIGVTA